MTPSMAFFTFLNAWWVMLFFVLPFGVKREEMRNPLHYAAAPKAHNWKKLIIVNTLLSLSVTLLLYLIIQSGVITLRDIS